MEPVRDYAAFCQSQLKSFKNLFVDQNCKQEILDMIKAIEEGRPILDIADSEKGTFSTIFEPFHFGNWEIQRFFRQGLPSNPNYWQFSGLAADIESMTDEYVIRENEPEEEERKELLGYLKKFIEILPDLDTFQSWLKN